MNRFDIAKGKKPPEPEPAPIPEPPSFDGFHMHGLVTITDKHGNKIEGYVQDTQYTMEAPQQPIRLMGGPIVDYVHGMISYRLDMSILVNRTIMAPDSSSLSLMNYLRPNTERMISND
jgi:hypothetical protein